jgi:transcriptional regulator with XRE-family HTH domain
MVLELREAIQHSGYTLNQLAKRCGLDSGRLSRFVRGERDLNLDAACRVCHVLGIQFVIPPMPIVNPADMPRPGRKPKGEGGESPAAVPPAKRRRGKHRDK